MSALTRERADHAKTVNMLADDIVQLTAQRDGLLAALREMLDAETAMLVCSGPLSASQAADLRIQRARTNARAILKLVKS